MAAGKWRRRLDFAWFSFTRLFQLHRILGIGALTVVAWFLFVHFSQTDMSWFLPKEVREFRWPDLPKFFVSSEKVAQGQETIYTVPSRQITAQEMAELKPQPKQK